MFELRCDGCAGGYDDGLIACSLCCYETLDIALQSHRTEQSVTDIVAVVAGPVDTQYRLYEFRRQLTHLVYGELHHQFVGMLLPHVANGQENKEVVVGLSPL